MQAQPKKSKKAYVMVVPVLMLLVGGGFYISGHPIGQPPTTTTQQQSVPFTLSKNLANVNIPLSEFVDAVKQEYFGTNFFGNLINPLTVTLSNDTFTLPANPIGASSMYVSSGTASFTPILVPLGLSFDFEGSAVAQIPGVGQATMTSLKMTFSTQQATTTQSAKTVTVTPTTTTQGPISISGLNSVFTGIMPKGLVNATVVAINSSPNPAEQVQSLSVYIAANPTLQSIPGVAGLTSQAAAAFILNAATTGTAWSDAAYSQLEAQFSTTTTTSTSSK
jgi:hypothetical protein